MNFTCRSVFFVCSVLSISQLSPVAVHAQTDPFFNLVFDEFIPGANGVHTDTHKIIVGKPVKTLHLSMKSSGDPSLGSKHLAGSEILLDLSSAFVTSYINSDSELSISAVFNTPLQMGEYAATKVVFGFDPGFFHETLGEASGTYFDGQSFYVQVGAGFIPEPSSLLLSLTGVFLVLGRSGRPDSDT